MPAWLKPILEKHIGTDEATKAALEKVYTEIDKATDAEIGKGFVARDDFNTANNEKKTADATIKTLEGQLEKLKEVDPDKLQQTIKDLQGENKKQKETYDADLKKRDLDAAIETKLTQAGAVNTKAVRVLLDETKISLDNGNLLGFEDQVTALKADANNKWAFAAPKTPPRSGGPQGTPPDAGGEKTLSDEIKEAVYGVPAQ